MKAVATSGARMTSSRLPGKALHPALAQPMLRHVEMGLCMVPSRHHIVLATTASAAEQPLARAWSAG